MIRRIITYEPAPAGTLNAEGSGVEFLLERLERAEIAVDGVFERAGVEVAAHAFASGFSTGEVLPEQGVVDVSYYPPYATSRSVTESCFMHRIGETGKGKWR